MEFDELVESFAERHGVANLAAEDGVVALDIDGIVVTLVVAGDTLSLAAEIGQPPVEGRADFADLLLKANLQTDAFFAKDSEADVYVLVRRLSLQMLDGKSFDAEIGALVNQAEIWRRLLADFRPAAEEVTAVGDVPARQFGLDGFMQV